MKRVAIIGAGISGLSTARLLQQIYDVTIYEKENKAGGLIRCDDVNGNLFHLCGGHVFNSKIEEVLSWFWSFFDRENEFIKAKRNSSIMMESGLMVPYPIENHIYMFDKPFQMSFYNDLLNNKQDPKINVSNFRDYLLEKFGKTLYDAYFKPYNEKIWKCDLADIPLSWLEGKLPMPTTSEIIYNNVNHIKEESFVHSSFWYEYKGGSQFLADRFAEGLKIHYNTNIDKIVYSNKRWEICGETYDILIFCGNIKKLPQILEGVNLGLYSEEIDKFTFHGTTSVFCIIDDNPYSWIYLPSSKYQAHRIICTGNFSPNNNVKGITTGTVEFTDRLSTCEIISQLQQIPLHPKYLTHNYNKYTYPIQNTNTRKTIKDLKQMMAEYSFYFTGRFADWEYYNMDNAIEAAMNTINVIKTNEWE